MRPVNTPYSEIAGYRLTRHIGSGGMGDVYKATHATLNREAAIKILFQKELANRFENEAYIQSSVNHPNIARLYEYVCNGEVHCIIMEFVEGESLDAYIHRKGKLSGEEAEKILVQISSALAYLHGKDIIHRDIKPANFKIQADGTVKMLDFGIAKHRYSPKFTQQGFVVGTTEYMAPEQFQQQVQKKSDIWSLGVMLYEMLTAYLPFEANNQVTLRARIARASFTDPKVLVPQIPESLMQVIEKSLRVNPASRMSAQEILSILKDKTPKAASVPQVRKPLQMPAFKLPVMKMPEVKMPALKMPRLNKMHMGVLLGLVLLVVLLVTKDDKQPPPPPPPPAEGVVTVPEVEKPSSQFKLVINVQGTDNAEIILANGERRKLPFETMGSNGEIVEGVIRANGFLDTLIRPVISHRKSVYTYELAKIK